MKWILFSLLFLLVLGCRKESIIPDTSKPDFDCSRTDLAVVKNYDDCQAPREYLGVCNTFDLTETVSLLADDFNWLPALCTDRSSIAFRNAEGESIQLKIVDREHYIHQTRDFLNCSQSIEHTNIVCQKNEKIALAFLNEDLLGADTLRLELSYFINHTVDDMPADPFLRIVLFQRRSNTNIANFYLSANVLEDRYDGTSRTYHSEVLLLGEQYDEVIELKVSRHVRGEPHQRYYLKKGIGLLAFSLDGELWLQP